MLQEFIAAKTDQDSHIFVFGLIHIYPNLAKPIQTFPNWSKPIWTCLKQSEHIWIYPNLSNPIWTCLNLSEPIQTYPILSEPIRTYPNLSEPVWTYPNLSNPIWTYPNLSNPIQTYPNLFICIIAAPFNEVVEFYQVKCNLMSCFWKKENLGQNPRMCLWNFLWWGEIFLIWQQSSWYHWPLMDHLSSFLLSIISC